MRKTLGLTLLLAMAVSAPASEPKQEVSAWSDLPQAAQESIRQSLREDLAWQQLAEVTGRDKTDADGFADLVAIDGDTVVVGAPGTTIGNNELQGAAYVFHKPKSGWGNVKQVAKLTASDGQTDDRFGFSVAVSGDTVMVGNFNLDDQAGGYIFVKPPHGWKTTHETAKLACGPYVGIGGDVAACAGFDQGAVFIKPPTGWKSTYKYDALLITTNGDKNTFSSIATNGDVVVIGAADINNESDVAYLYVKPKGGWHVKSNHGRLRQTAKLTNSDSTENDEFGLSVSISGDTVAVGAPYATDNDGNSGAAYVFVKPTTGWTNMTETAKLTANTTDSISTLGFSVALCSNTLVAGNPTGTVADDAQGEAYVFVEPAGGWATTSTFNARLTASDGQKYDYFGNAVSLSGTTIVVGNNRSFIHLPGAAYVFGQ